MSTRKSGKASAAKSKVAARKAKAATANKQPPEKISIRYDHAPDYKQFFSTGSLVRAERDTVTVTFYIDEMKPVRHMAKLVSVEERGPFYQIGEIEEEPRRLIVASVRIDPEQAASLASLIAEKCYTIRPELFPQVDAIVKDDGKKK